MFRGSNTSPNQSISRSCSDLKKLGFQTETELFILYIKVEGIAGIGRAAAESFKVERFGHADIGHRPDAHGVAEHGDEGEKVPAEEAEVEREKLALVPGHHGLGFTDALHGRLCGIIDENIDSLTVAIVGDDARKQKQHGPQPYKDRFEDVQNNDLEPEAEAVKEVAEAGRIAAGGVEQEKPQRLENGSFATELDKAMSMESRGAVGLNISGDTNSLIKEAAARYQVDPRLVAAVAQTESGGNQEAVSPAGAVGVMQLMPETAAGLGVNPYDKRQNIEGGAKYLRQMMDTFGGDVQKAVAAYNAGPQAVKEYNGIPPYRETQDYVNKVLDIYR